MGYRPSIDGNESSTSNPVHRYYQWKSSEQAFVQYDKELKANIPAKNQRVVFLAKTFSITGYSKKHEGGIFSNQVENLKEEKLKVYVREGSHNELVTEGIYSDIKGDLLLLNKGKFTINWYCLCPCDDNELKICVFQFSGCAVGSLIEFENSFTPFKQSKGLVLKQVKQERNGNIEYYVPVFEPITEISDTVREQAKEAQKTVWSYLDSILQKAKEEETKEAVAPMTKEEDSYLNGNAQQSSKVTPPVAMAYDDDLPF